MQMHFQLDEEPITALPALDDISIAFDVTSVFDATPHQTIAGQQYVLRERTLAMPYRKDYDTIADNKPSSWAKRFDISRWGLITARVQTSRVGAAVIAFDTPAVNLLESRRDLALLWDMRVAPEHRGNGVGNALFEAAASWAAEKGCRQLKVETQNINVAACRFYERQGCVLGAVDAHAYADLPQEVRLLWYKALTTT